MIIMTEKTQNPLHEDDSNNVSTQAERPEHLPSPMTQRAHHGVLLSLLAIIAVLIALLILGIRILKKNLEVPLSKEPVQIIQIDKL
jgi:hypothetical protein